MKNTAGRIKNNPIYRWQVSTNGGSSWGNSGAANIWGANVTVTIHLGAIGRNIALGPEGFTVGGANLFGITLSVDGLQ